jgi:type IV pilus biogenesis protein CpaD/CtpE
MMNVNLDLMQRLVAGGALALLAACAQTPKPAPTPEPVSTSAQPPGTSADEQRASAAVPGPPTTLSPQETQRAISAAIDQLQAGQEDQAEVELRRVLAADPANRLAQSLLRQIKDDPIATLGRESFAYRVQPGESLSRIAQRFLNDLHQFYILARYNGIRVPRNLAGGQTIRVPGKQPAGLTAAGDPGTIPTATTNAIPVPVPAKPAPEPVGDPAATLAAAERQRVETIARYSRDARSAFAKQDLDSAIRSWDAVLRLDPDNRTALLERQKAQGLKEKLGKLK